MNNLLLEPILAILRASPEGISEYELTVRLKAETRLISQDRPDSNLTIFQTHFMVMNALYQLRESMITEQRRLTISALSIKLEAITAYTADTLPSIDHEAETKLSTYYLDLDNLKSTTEEDVNDLLNGFWGRFYAIEEQAKALDCLGLASDAAWYEIQQAYRKLAAQHHPDKGGQEARFIEVRGAYEALKRCRMTKAQQGS